MSMRLSELVRRDLAEDPPIAGVTADSRKVAPGFLFAALPGVKVDGAEFAPKAVAAGAAAVISGRPIGGLGAPVVVTPDPRRAYALASAAFFGRQPQTCVAVTGTNGKTSVAGFCRQVFARTGRTGASMGTLGVRIARPGPEADLQITPPGLTLDARFGCPHRAGGGPPSSDCGREGPGSCAWAADGQQPVSVTTGEPARKPWRTMTADAAMDGY